MCQSLGVIEDICKSFAFIWVFLYCKGIKVSAIFRIHSVIVLAIPSFNWWFLAPKSLSWKTSYYGGSQNRDSSYCMYRLYVYPILITTLMIDGVFDDSSNPKLIIIFILIVYRLLLWIFLSDFINSDFFWQLAFFLITCQFTPLTISS